MAGEVEFLEIDGSILEGGGQILRIATALSAVLSRPIRIAQIRAGRLKPGLRAQHSCCVKLVSEICHAPLCDGSGIDSKCLRLQPGRIQSDTYRSDIGTAGSVCLLSQAALPVLAFAPAQSQLILQGGTNAEFAPPVDHFADAFRHAASKFGLNFDMVTDRRGFFPKGGGQCTVQVKPCKQLNSVTLLDQGKLLKLRGCAFACGKVTRSIAERIKAAAVESLTAAFPGVDIDIKVDTECAATGSGCGIAVSADTDTGCVLAANCVGKRELSAEQIGSTTADSLIRDLRSGACVDSHTQDQVVVLMALAEGVSSIRCSKLTLHTKTAMHIAKLIGGVEFTVKPEDGDDGCVISCTGIGLTNQSLHGDE